MTPTHWDEMRPMTRSILGAVGLVALLAHVAACEVPEGKRITESRSEYQHLIPAMPTLALALPAVTVPPTRVEESQLLSSWRGQFAYWQFAIESIFEELQKRDTDIPLIVDLQAERIVWGPYRSASVDEWCVVAPLDGYRADWTLETDGQPFNRSFARVGASALEELLSGEIWLQLGTRDVDLGSTRGLAFWDRLRMIELEAIEPLDNALITFDTMTYLYELSADATLLTQGWVGLTNVVVPQLNLTLPEFGATWGTNNVNGSDVSYLGFVGVIDADGDGVAFETADIRIAYRLAEGQVIAGRGEAFWRTPDDTALEGWAVIHCLGVGGEATQVYHVPVQRGDGDPELALQAFTSECAEGFRSGLSTLNIPFATVLPPEVIWAQESIVTDEAR